VATCLIKSTTTKRKKIEFSPLETELRSQRLNKSEIHSRASATSANVMTIFLRLATVEIAERKSKASVIQDNDFCQ